MDISQSTDHSIPNKWCIFSILLVILCSDDPLKCHSYGVSKNSVFSILVCRVLLGDIKVCLFVCAWVHACTIKLLRIWSVLYKLCHSVNKVNKLLVCYTLHARDLTKPQQHNMYQFEHFSFWKSLLMKTYMGQIDQIDSCLHVHIDRSQDQLGVWLFFFHLFDELWYLLRNIIKVSLILLW